MAIVETRIAAYITGASFAPNRSEQVDISVAQDGSEMETRYYCSIHATFETAYDGGGTRIEPASKNVRLTATDTGLDYRLAKWSMEEMAKSLPNALLNVSSAGKQAFAGFDPKYDKYTVEKL